MKAPALNQRIAEDLSCVSADRRVTVSVRDILHIFRTQEELNDVLHRAELGSLESFNTWRSTVYPFLPKAYYERCWGMLPEDIRNSIEERG